MRESHLIQYYQNILLLEIVEKFVGARALKVAPTAQPALEALQATTISEVEGKEPIPVYGAATIASMEGTTKLAFINSGSVLPMKVKKTQPVPGESSAKTGLSPSQKSPPEELVSASGSACTTSKAQMQQS